VAEGAKEQREKVLGEVQGFRAAGLAAGGGASRGARQGYGTSNTRVGSDEVRHVLLFSMAQAK